MAKSRRRVAWFGFPLTLVLLAAGALALGGLRVSRAEVRTHPNEPPTHQVTVFAILATPASKTTDSNLVTIEAQLERLLPRYGFKLLDAQSKRLEAGKSVACDLNNGCRVETFLVRTADENGKVQFRCELFQDKTRRLSTLVAAPLNQLFFYERMLPEKSRLLIGVGAR